jgi:hypothetical protein
MALEKFQIMKNYILTIGTVLFLISCGKSEKPIESEKLQDKIALTPKESEIKEVETPIYNYEKDSNFSKELDLALLEKVVTNLKIKYEKIQIDKTSFISYNNDISFFVISYIAEKAKQDIQKEGDDLGDYFERIYVFAHKTDGKIIAKEIDKNSSYYDDEAVKPEKTEIFKNLVQLNKVNSGVALSTFYSINNRNVGYDETKFSILALVGNRIIKLVYEYPIGIENSDSIDGIYKSETVNAKVSISNRETNGFFDLKVTKIFQYEEGKEEDVENENNNKIIHKTKKESQVLKFNGKIYPFDPKDRLRFL